MAMIVGDTSGIWNALSQANLRLYQFNMERGRILLQGAAAQEMIRELAHINAVYDGKKETAYEAQINKLFAEKSDLAATKTSLDNALKKIENLRLEYINLAGLAVSGATEAFDLKLHDINYCAGSSTGSLENLTNLIGNRSRGTWSDRVTIVSINGFDIQVRSQFLGSDYQIVSDDGRTLSYDRINKSVGPCAFSDLAVGTSQSAIEDGGRIVFKYHNPDTLADETIEGTLKMGGLAIGNAWMYGMEDTSRYARDITSLKNDINALVEETVQANKGTAARFFALPANEQNDIIALLNPSDAATVQAKLAEIGTLSFAYEAARESNKAVGKELAATVKQAIRQLDKATQDFEMSSALVNSATKKYDTLMKDLQRKYDDASRETLNAKSAARTALKAKMELADTKFALSSTTAATLISGLFSYKTRDNTTSLFDILKKDQYRAYKDLMGIP